MSNRVFKVLVTLLVLGVTQQVAAKCPSEPGVQQKSGEDCVWFFNEGAGEWECLSASGGGGSTACSPAQFCYLPACDFRNFWGNECLAKWTSCNTTQQSCTCKGDMGLGTHTRRREGGGL